MIEASSNEKQTTERKESENIHIYYSLYSAARSTHKGPKIHTDILHTLYFQHKKCIVSFFNNLHP